MNKQMGSQMGGGWTERQHADEWTNSKADKWMDDQMDRQNIHFFYAVAKIKSGMEGNKNCYLSRRK